MNMFYSKGTKRMMDIKVIGGMPMNKYMNNFLISKYNLLKFSSTFLYDIATDNPHKS